MSNEFHGIELFPKQKEIVEAVENSVAKYFVISAGRLSGKTTLAQNLLIKWALENDNQVLWFVSPYINRSKQVYREIKNAVIEHDFVLAKNEAELSISFDNGSIIVCKGADNYDALRGNNNINFLIIDEFVFLKDEAWINVLLPITARVDCKKVFLMSTPRGSGDIFHKLFNTKNNNYQSFTFTSYDNPFTDKQILDDYHNYGEFTYRSEILAEFVSNYSGYFQNIDECALGIEGYFTGGQYYAGLDSAVGLGPSHDYSVISIVDSNNILVFQKRFQALDTPSVAAVFEDVLRTWGNPPGLVEANGLGRGVLDILLSNGQTQLIAFNTSSANKQQIISNLGVALTKKELLIPASYSDLITELKAFTFTIRSRGVIDFHAPMGQHDDTVMSLAIALEAKRSLTLWTNTTFYFPNGVRI